MPYDTSLDLQSSRIYDYRNSWAVLDGGDHFSQGKPLNKHRLHGVNGIWKSYDGFLQRSTPPSTFS
jgi:hypothetical protein